MCLLVVPGNRILAEHMRVKLTQIMQRAQNRNEFIYVYWAKCLHCMHTAWALRAYCARRGARILT